MRLSLHRLDRGIKRLARKVRLERQTARQQRHFKREATHRPRIRLSAINFGRPRLPFQVAMSENDKYRAGYVRALRDNLRSLREATTPEFAA